MRAEPKFLSVNGDNIAYHHCHGTEPGVLWLGGFMSDMEGGKATALQTFSESKGWQFTRFDYGGHGASSGRFEEGTIGQWLGHAAAVLDDITQGPQILVGSSMGGWMMLLLALARPERVAGLVGIASAPDFTEDLMWAEFSAEQKKEMEQAGRVILPNCMPGEAPYPITRELIEEGRAHRLMQADTIAIDCPVHLLHGMQDPDVPWQLSVRLAEKLSRDDVQVTLVKNGDHRMSEPENLQLLQQTVSAMVNRAMDHIEPPPEPA